ncbi:MAG: HAMP domain-containing sensor histidine kinase [Anaerolineales bacterium]
MYILSFLPAGIGIITAVLAANYLILNPVLYLRGNLAALAVFGGVLLSIFAVASTYLIYRNQERHQRELLNVHNQAAEDRRRFLYRLDHELKNPLTAIQAGLTNLSDEDLGEYLCNEVSAVKTQVLRISRLVADLRKLAALETTSLERTVVNTAELLTDVVGFFKNDTNNPGRSLALILPNAPRPLPNVEGDPDLLLLAIHNLLDNAVKFTVPGDTIEVRASENGTEIVIEIADTGPGISERELGLVWEELYRSEQARGVPGSGLGLPLVRAIIEKHGGMVGLRSMHGQGTVFSVRLPARN